MPHLIRGIIDGDGWVTYKTHTIGLCGNDILVPQVHDFLSDKLNLTTKKITHQDTHLWTVGWRNYDEVESIGKYIYNDKQDCYLARKYMNFIKILTYRKRKDLLEAELLQENTEIIS